MSFEREYAAKHPRSKKWPRYWTGRKAELAARKEPDAEWVITIHGPMNGRTWKRSGKNVWGLVESNRGFA